MQTVNQTKNTQIEICLYCGFAENPPGAHYCLQCYRSLEDRDTSSKTSWVSWSSFPLVLLLLFSGCLLYTSPSPRDLSTSRMPSSA